MSWSAYPPTVVARVAVLLAAISSGLHIAAQETPAPSAYEERATQHIERWQTIHSLLGTEDEPKLLYYRWAVDGTDSGSAPLLKKMLANPAYKNRWMYISKLLLWSCDKDDEAAAAAVLDYIRRPDTWSRAEVRDPFRHYNAKAVALEYLGLLKTESARAALRGAFAQEGAEKLISAWIDLPHDVEFIGNPHEFYVSSIRRSAATGLVLSREPKSVALVRERFEEFVHKTQWAVYRKGVAEAEMDRAESEYLLLADAMMEHDMINDLGLERYLRIHDTEASIHLALEKYVTTYCGEKKPNGRYIVDPCPVCGKPGK